MYLQLLDKKNLRLNTESQRSPFGLRSELYTLSDHLLVGQFLEFTTNV